MTEPINNLKKIRLIIKAGDGNGNSLTAEPVPFSFIVGVASGGLCPLEASLGTKVVGDRVTLTIAQPDLHETCGHLFPALRDALNLVLVPKRLILEMVVDGVEECSQRDVVAAISAAVGSGCGGGCDCGCG